MEVNTYFRTRLNSRFKLNLWKSKVKFKMFQMFPKICRARCIHMHNQNITTLIWCYVSSKFFKNVNLLYLNKYGEFYVQLHTIERLACQVW